MSLISAKSDQALMADLWDPAIADDPYKFVMHCFPWGKKGTPLEYHTGPRKWQREELERIRDHIRDNRTRMINKQPPLVFKSATVSGRGVGKSSLTAWLVLWFMSTRLGGTVVVTANTEAQLKSRTWGEVGKWHTLAINTHWFEKTALSLKPAPWFEQELKDQWKIDSTYYYAQAQLWDEEKPDSFAGIHNHNGVTVIFDEASGIPKAIWTVTSGFFTEPILDRYHFAFSNGRRNTGEFFECFHKNRGVWLRRNLDSRTVEGTDVNELNQIVLQHGEDSDEARIEVKGEFPRQGANQFISRDLVNQAISRELVPDEWAPLIMGVDPARYGDDSTVIAFRQGRNARVLPMIEMKGADNMEVANKCAELILQYNPDAVAIDAGNGTGIIDRLREMKFKVHEVWFGSKSPEDQWANLRTYMWAKIREWLGGGCLPSDQDLTDDLTSPEYKFMGAGDVMALESKESMKKRGFASPDRGDALACTFAVNVARRDLRVAKTGASRGREARDVDYSIFGS